jgi:hypothetical protein
MNFLTPAISSLLNNDEEWCKKMGFFNPYLDPFDHHLRGDLPIYDGEAYKMYPDHNYVYDKLWVAESQKLNCGRLEDLIKSPHEVPYPVFIKPRWGHLSAASKNCFKISSPQELQQYAHFKHMMWSEFIDGREGMTDYVMLNGRIMHYVSYIYSEGQNGFTDEWKYVSPSTKPPLVVTEWIDRNLSGYTGVVNIQYRDEKIIEVGLRLARSGAYIIATDNDALINNICNVVDNRFWDFSLQQRLGFAPYYAFKCFTTFPIIYIWPQYLLDLIVPFGTSKPFYEYYFEPAGKSGMVFLQFMHDDFDKGMAHKRNIERLFALTQVITIIAALVIIGLLFTNFKYKYYLVAISVLLYLTRFLNPISATHNLYKGQRQALFGGGPVSGPEDFGLQ